MKYYPLFFIILIFALFSCEKEPDIPTGQGNKIELAVTTDNLTRIDVTAIATGSIQNLGYMGEVVQHGHCWGITPQPDITYFRTQLGYKNTKGEFTSTLTGLDLNTTYYVRAYIANETHVAYGEQKVINAVCGGETEISYEGQSYKILPMGNQCWMGRNLNVGNFVSTTVTPYPHSDISNDGNIEKYCYEDSINNCNTYGGLYDWNEMMMYTQTEGAKGICPNGWHIPTNEEWEKLVSYLGGNYTAGIALKGTAVNQFGAMLKGYRLSNGTFVEKNLGTRYWTSSKNHDDLPYYRYLTSTYDGVINKNYNTSGAFHVRCIKND